MDVATFCALLWVLLTELANAFATLSRNTVSYFIKHLVCMLYLSHRNRKTPLRFPEPELTTTEHSPESMGLIYSEREWEQERPKSKEHLKNKEDFHIFQGTHIESNSTLIFRLSRLQEGLCQAFIVFRLKAGDVLVLQNEIKLDLSDTSSYYGCGLKLECLAPMRRWRVNFNGLLKNQNGEDVHVKFNGIWVAGSHTFEYPQQISMKSMADSLSNLHPFSMAAQIRSIYNDEFFYSQIGRFDLEASVGGSPPEEVHMWGSRLHFAGALEPRTEIHKFGHFRKGHRLHLISRNVESQMLYFGSAYEPRTKTVAITSADMIPEAVVATTDQDVFAMSVQEQTLQRQFITTGHPKINDKFTIYQENATMDGEKGVILTMEVERYNRPLLPLPAEYKHHMPNNGRPLLTLALATTDDDCKRPALAGGKGSSLAVLASISQQFHNFTVPPAVVVTTLASDLFFSVPAARQAVQQLSDVVYKESTPDELRAACERCTTVIETTPIPTKIVEQVRRKLSVFGELGNLRFAVRSSAVGEDSEEMSTAGQMTTCLGVPATDLKRIANAVAKCWASQFNFNAVSYKTRLGQPIARRMAVVVQEMVSAQVSGVMFTCDPETANPGVIKITANYGLRVSEVSASADPDTFTVIRSPNGEVDLVDCASGEKKTPVEENIKNGGTVENDLDEEDAEKACVPRSVVEKLAHIGQQVESCFTTPRDIEWALVDNQVYLLQNRAVTSVTRDTDFEIVNDMNGNIRSEGDIFSKAIVAEIFPGALSPLGISTLSTTFDILCREFQLQWRALDVVESSLYVTTSTNTLRKQVFLDVSDTALAGDAERLKMLVAYGRDVSREAAFTEGVRRAQLPGGIIAKLKGLLSVTKMFYLNRDLEEIHEKTKSFHIHHNSYSSLEQLREIVAAFREVKPAAIACCYAFLETSFFDDIIVSLLTKSTNGEMTPELVSAAADLLKASDATESVDVVLSLHKIGAALSKSGEKEKFLRMTPEEALKWLKASKSEIGTMFSNLLERHGHRCVKEFDVQSQTWGMQPLSVVKTLQVVARNPQEERRSTSAKTTIKNIPVSFGRKLLLRLLLLRARRAVTRRDIARSGIIRILHKLRLAFHNLADLMVAEGRLPHKELVFYLSVDEIYRLITSGTFKLIERADRRRRLHPKLEQEKYPVLLYGFPKKAERKVFTNAVLQVCGTSICEGVVEGRARVVKDFESEAQLIEKDEILVTTATGTELTPYFPMLGGIVTEVGGLVSHGAVVAREYGVPCVVGIENVTEMFVSGDLLRLDATKGTVQKIQAP